MKKKILWKKILFEKFANLGMEKKNYDKWHERRILGLK